MINIDGASYLDVQEAAERLGVKPETLYAYVSRGMLRSYKQGIRRRRLYLQSEIEALLSLRPPDSAAGGSESLTATPLNPVSGPAAPSAPLPRADEWASER